MKVKVITRFKDKFKKSVIYEVGQVVDFEDDARCADLQRRGLAVPAETKEESGKPSAKAEGKTSKPAKQTKTAKNNK
ncbi:MAG: hypothetical protein E7108_08745 [Bacteroidales bacterium]|jgi:hypothetical protein|nr:hypothetical protein [Bacteroidales bacterium]